MGQAILCYEVLPESVEAMDAVEAKLKEMGPNKLEKKPVAFGLCSFEVNFIIEDKEGADTDEVERKLEEIEGVGSVTCQGVTLA